MGLELKTSLAKLKKNKTSIKIYLVSGISLNGVIGDFDDDCIFYEDGMIIFKSAIATVAPQE